MPLVTWYKAVLMLPDTEGQFHTGPQENIRFDVPHGAFIDEDVRIRLTGLAPQQKVRIRATTEDDENRRWSSEGHFRADANGSLDLATQESTAGTYRGVAPMGLFWSMCMARDFERKSAGTRATFAKKDSMPHSVLLEAELGRCVIVSGRIERKFRARGTVLRDLLLSADERFETAPDSNRALMNRRTGRLFLPAISNPGRSRLPVVVVLSGSGGGFDIDKAAVLSRHGFATLALAYFGVPPLATWLHSVALEYIASALAWLTAQPEIDPERIALLSVSRGSELALIAASRFPAIRAVVAYAPSSVAWDSGGREKRTGKSIPAWLWQGQPIQSAPLPLRGFMWRSAFPVIAMRRAVMFRKLFLAGLRNSEAVAEAAISVEQIKGPTLLISGGDDHVWPAKEMAEAIIARLEKNRFQHAVEHLHYPSAGHLLRYPHLPTTVRSSAHEHLRGARLSFGGTAQADAEAQADSWRRSIAFLKKHL